jgi:phospholipid transport system substrate-binding protein
MNLGLRSFVGLAVLAVAAPACAATEGGSATRAAAYDDAIIGVMKLKAPLATRVERFRTIVTDYYDMPGIAALVAGPAWGSASAADRQAFTTALTRHSAISLAKNFKSYDGEQFVIDPALQSRADGVIVKVTIKGSGGSKDMLYYRMRGTKIVDVVSSGVSQVAVQRSDLASTAGSGGITAIVKRLDEVDAKAVH